MLPWQLQPTKRQLHFFTTAAALDFESKGVCECKDSSPVFPQLYLFQWRLAQHCTLPITSAANSIQPSCKHKPDQPADTRTAHAPVSAPLVCAEGGEALVLPNDMMLTELSLGL